MTQSQMKLRIAELEEQNEDLQNRLDSVMDIIQPEIEGCDDDDDDDDEEDDDNED